MSKPKSTKVDVAEGSYDMVVKTVADIGTQTVTKFNSEETEEKKQIIVVVELVEESTKAKPLTLTKWMTNSVGKKSSGFALMKAAGLDPNKADWNDLLNKAVVGVVEHTESGNAKIKSFSPIKKGAKVARGFLSTNSVFLDETFDRESFEAMPEFIQNSIIKSPEFEEIDSKRSKSKNTSNKKVKK